MCDDGDSDSLLFFSLLGCNQLLDEAQVTLSFQDWLASVTERIHQTMHYQFEGKSGFRNHCPRAPGASSVVSSALFKQPSSRQH